MDISTLNWLAVLAATISAFVLGGLWYSPFMFGKAWTRVNGFSEADMKTRNMGRIFGFAFVLTFVMAFNLAMFLNDKNTTTSWGAAAGFLAGFGWIAMGIFIIGLFENRSMKYMLINAGYMTVALVLMGLILGAWR